MWRCFAMVVVLMLAQPAMARDVTGVLAAPATPLPPGAELHLQLIGPDGVTADQRLPVRIADPAVAMPLMLDADSDEDLTLLAAIYAGGVPVWVTDGIAVPAGDATVDLGSVVLVRPTLPGGLAPMLCGDLPIALSTSASQARLAGAGRAVMTLPVDPGNPNRFTDGASRDTTVTRLGNRATLILLGTPLPACSPTMPPPLFPLRAGGVNPGWTLIADRANMALTREDGVTAVAGAAQVRAMADGLALFAQPDMNLILIHGDCTDGRLPFPMQATLTMPGTTLKGCAGNAVDVMAGAWGVDVVDGVTMPEDEVVRLTFTKTKVAGFAACNRFTAPLADKADVPLFGPPVTTRMACAEPQILIERAFLAALPRVTQAAINAQGELELRDADTLLIRAYR